MFDPGSRQPNHQAAIIRSHWRREPLEAIALMDLIAPLENISVSLTGSNRCPILS